MSETAFPVIVSDDGGNVTIEKSTDLLARQQAAMSKEGLITYTPPTESEKEEEVSDES